MYFTKYCANDRTISLGPKRSFEKKKTFQNTAVFTVTKVFLPLFSRIIECDRAHVTMHKGLQYILTVTVEVITYFLKDLRGC